MAHLLFFETALGSDHEIFETAVRMGHGFSFVTADIHAQDRNPGVQEYLKQARAVLEIAPFSYEAFEEAVLALHAQHPIDAIICFFDRRQVEAGRLAKKLGLCYLNPQTAELMYDKYNVRRFLEDRGIAQPEYRQASNLPELKPAIAEVGYPLLVKPADGFGSNEIMIMRNAEEHEAFAQVIENWFPRANSWALGVAAGQRMIVERYMAGKLLRCDTVSVSGKHTLIGINEMLMFEPPYCAVKGSTYPSTRFDRDAIHAYLSRVLDLLGFDWGFANTELMITDDGPFIVEINPRIGSFHKLIGLAYDRSMLEAVIGLHLHRTLEPFGEPSYYTASRWIVSRQHGILVELQLPEDPANFAGIIPLAQPGDFVSYPWVNGSRLAGVIARERTLEAAEEAAERFVRGTKVLVHTGS